MKLIKVWRSKFNKPIAKNRTWQIGDKILRYPEEKMKQVDSAYKT